MIPSSMVKWLLEKETDKMNPEQFTDLEGKTLQTSSMVY